MIPWTMVSLALIGLFLNVMQRREGFLFWVASNGGMMVISYQRGDYPQTLLFLAQLGASLAGWWVWGRADGQKKGDRAS